MHAELLKQLLQYYNMFFRSQIILLKSVLNFQLAKNQCST